MKLKKIDYLLAIFLMGLIIVVGCIVLIMNGDKDKDIRKAKVFVEKLYDNDMVDKKRTVDELTFERLDKRINVDNRGTSTITAQEYGIDLDKEYNVIGFSNRTNVIGEVNVDLDEAKVLGEKFGRLVTEGEVSLKSTKEVRDLEQVPYYTLIYSQYKYGYPYYFDELAISINKTTGKLDGFSISNVQGNAKKPVINIDKEKAVNIALNKFNEVNKDAVLNEELVLAYGLRREKSEKSELCYVITVSGKDTQDKDVSYNYFVSTDKGELVDSFSNLISETKTSK